MDIRKISDQFFVSPQISETDLAAIKEQGIKSISATVRTVKARINRPSTNWS